MHPSSSRAVSAIAMVTLLGAGALAGTVAARDHRSTKSVINSLAVSGNPAKPIFTITGTDLRIPAPNPRKSPSGQKLCPVTISGNAGLDYGTSFYLVAWDGQPAGDNKQLYSAGRYRPNLGELDCIGLVVVSKAPSRVTFTFGHAYQQYRSQYRTLLNRDVIEVVLNGAAAATVVHYRS